MNVSMTDPVDVCRDLLTESMVRINDQAFEKARVEFGIAYLDAYRKACLGVEADQAHFEAQDQALEVFLASYLTEVER